MKHKLLSAFALAGLLLNSCAVDELPTEGGSIVAEMETDRTKTSVTDEGTFTWSAGDKVWLHTTSGSVVGTLSSGAGTSSAQFTYGAYFGSMTGKAVYPYNAGHAVSENELSIVLPASYDLGSSLTNTNAAMYGVNVGGTIKFNHLAGVMRFKFKDVRTSRCEQIHHHSRQEDQRYFRSRPDRRLSCDRDIFVFDCIRENHHIEFQCIDRKI